MLSRYLFWKHLFAAGALLALLFSINLSPTEAIAGKRGYGGGHGGGGGGGVGIGVGVGVGAILLNEAIRRKQQKQQQQHEGPREVKDKPRGCEPPAVYSKKRGCYVPTKNKEKDRPPEKKEQQAKCEKPFVYSKRRGCYNPNPGKHDEPQVTKCEAPMYYSRAAGGCVKRDDEPQHAKCERPYYYSEAAHGCVKRDNEPEPVVCRYPYVESGHGCICAPGLIPGGGACIKPPVIVVDPGRPGPPAFEPLPPSEGPPPERPQPVANPPKDRGPPEPPREKPVQIASPVPPQRCLPQDLYDLLKDTYGKTPAFNPCPNACLPKPASFSQGELDGLAAKSGINWCDNCIDVGAYMPLPAILEIEQRANINICVNPDLCRLPPRVVKQTEIRTIFKDLPAGVKNEGNIAVVVGNHDYQGDLPDNDYGITDADAVDALLVDQLGYKKENIIDLRDGKLEDFERVFGSEGDPGGEIAKRIDKQDPDDVFVYIASHGMVKEDDTKQVYLLPIDARIDDLDRTGYDLQKLYDNLGKTGARTTMLMLEANFAKNLDELIDPPNLPELEVEAMPATPIAGLAVFKASDRDQRTIQDPEYGIGLFTRYMIEGLAGRADVAPLGNDDKRIDTVELYVYTSDMVRQAARKSFGLEQKPILSKIDNLLIGQLTSN